MSFINRLEAAWHHQDSLLCVGLDPDPERFPEGIAPDLTGILDFNRAIIDATHDLVCAYKPQIAYYAALGAEPQLEATIAYIQDNYPHIPVVLDAKRGDIGSTARQYAVEAFERYGADAVTVNPYLGFDAIKPFLEYQDRGVILLARTSNPGAAELQDLDVGGLPLYARIAQLAAQQWNAHGNIGLVVGATWPQQLEKVRVEAPELPLLLPGIGAQGGSIAAAVAAGRRADGKGLLVSASRSVLYASSGTDFAEAARREATQLVTQINAARQPTLAI